jgi:phage baseplate assembly protein W
MDNIPHPAIPIRYQNGHLVTIQQGSTDDGIVTVWVITHFERGSRSERLDFGINDPTLKMMPIDVDDIANAIREFEPRVNATISTSSDPSGKETVNISVRMPGNEEVREDLT